MLFTLLREPVERQQIIIFFIFEFISKNLLIKLKSISFLIEERLDIILVSV